jgi:hypothetical protein
MTDPTPGAPAPAADLRAQMAQAEAQMRQAAAAAAQADKPHLLAVRDALQGEAVAALLETLSSARDGLTDEPTRQQLWNILAVVRSGRAAVLNGLARAEQAILAVEGPDQ